MSNDDYQRKHWWEDEKPLCVEKDEKGNCLMSIQFVMIDMGQPDGKPKLFCEEQKTNKHDKTT